MQPRDRTPPRANEWPDDAVMFACTPLVDDILWSGYRIAVATFGMGLVLGVLATLMLERWL